MKIIGLTGSIGMGKSVAAALLRSLGLPVHDSDAVAHGLLAPYGKAFMIVARTFPDAWDSKTHLIDRRKLGEIVFNDSWEKHRLESIIHPLIWESQRNFVLQARRNGFENVVFDIPLLFETGADARCDVVMCVTAPYFVQRQRVLSRPGMTEEKFFAILNAQMPDQEKRRRADAVIPTGLGRAHTLQAIKNFLTRIEL